MKPGRVVVQSYQPEHYSIQHASHHDYTGFFEKELDIRRQFAYPPFTHIIRVLITGEDEKEVVQYAKNMLKWIKEKVEIDESLKSGLVELGLFEAPILRINNKYRWQVLIRIEQGIHIKEAWHHLSEGLIRGFYREDVTVTLDFNPLSLI